MSRMLEALKRLQHERGAFAEPVVDLLPFDPASHAPAESPVESTARQIEQRLDALAHLATTVDESAAHAPTAADATALPLDVANVPVPTPRIPPPALGRPRAKGLARPAITEVPESIVRLRERILAQLPHDRALTIGFVHPGDVDDATATVAQLAVAFTQVTTGDILALDANFAVAGELVHDNEERFGLIDCLAGRANWLATVSPTRNPRVILLPSGRWSGRDTDAAARLQPFLAELHERFAAVLVDVGAVDNPLLESFAVACDAIYLVVQLNRTPQRAVQRAVAKLQEVSALVAGCVLTGASPGEA